MAQEPQTASEAENAVPFHAPEVDALSVVDRIALRMLCAKVCGVTTRPTNMTSALELWRTTPESNREAWRCEARAVLADIADGDNDEMWAWPEYQVRHPDGAVQGGYDDVSDAVHFLETVWPTGEVRRRTYVTVRSEWTEVTA